MRFDMRYLFTLLTLAFAVVLASCSNNDAPNAEIYDGITTLTFTTTDETRTHLSSDATHAEWDSSDKLMVYESATTTTARTSRKTSIDSSGKASFSVDFPTNSSNSISYVSVYPAEAVSNTSNPKISNTNITIPSQQQATATSYDGAADILISGIIKRAQQQSTLSIKFKRMVAIAKMELSRIPFESIDKVVFRAYNAELAGSVSADLSKATFTSHQSTTDNITISYATPISANAPIYFTLLPATLNAGSKCEITVYSGSESYSHEFSIPTGRSLRFEQGSISSFNVDMCYEKPTGGDEGEPADLSEMEGDWALYEWCGSTKFDFDIYLSIAASGSIELWQRLENRAWDYYYSTVTSADGVLSGTYSDGVKWGASYRCTMNDADTMTWVNTIDSNDVSVYVRTELPNDLTTTRSNEQNSKRFL